MNVNHTTGWAFNGEGKTRKHKYLYESVPNLKHVGTDSTSILVSSRKQAIRRDIEMVSTGSAIGLLL